jgi:hypothetical protein
MMQACGASRALLPTQATRHVARRLPFRLSQNLCPGAGKKRSGPVKMSSERRGVCGQCAIDAGQSRTKTGSTRPIANASNCQCVRRVTIPAGAGPGGWDRSPCGQRVANVWPTCGQRVANVLHTACVPQVSSCPQCGQSLQSHSTAAVSAMAEELGTSGRARDKRPPQGVAFVDRWAVRCLSEASNQLTPAIPARRSVTDV